MFGRDLTEQVEIDSKDEARQIPVIVDKCIEAVEERGLCCFRIGLAHILILFCL